MNCPYCGEHMDVSEHFGRFASFQDGKVSGDIYQCMNEDCDEHYAYFYTLRDTGDKLYNGYPC
jgi:hypothetical protein